ncbi:hypothetical protein [Thermogemmatispora sp.]|uniref:hypothetical protein n=1 Tax=Thermogemmatispora sp. TaxID=1968838 RepID=UPI002ACC148A|nr:hypothetical protein [Thermogemmatispora sp.]
MALERESLLGEGGAHDGIGEAEAGQQLLQGGRQETFIGDAQQAEQQGAETDVLCAVLAGLVFGESENALQGGIGDKEGLDPHDGIATLVGLFSGRGEGLLQGWVKLPRQLQGRAFLLQQGFDSGSDQSAGRAGWEQVEVPRLGRAESEQEVERSEHSVTPLAGSL